MKKKQNNKIKDRKLDHIKIVMEEETEPFPSSFDSYQLPYTALPELDMTKISMKTSFLDKELSFPFVISSMTGGPDKGLTINRNLAIAAEEEKVALGLGSMRVIIRKPESIKSFDVRKYCPSVPLLANVGIVQLNYGFGADEINRIMDAIDADGIFLHINPLQEAIQPEGDTNFEDLLRKLGKALPQIERPVVVKEVGTGIDFRTAKRLRNIGIKWIDVSGTGGTHWGWVEGYRRDDDLGYLFRKEGIPTAEAIQTIKRLRSLKLIAGGGIRNGLHIAKAIAMGAELATAAKPLLKPALAKPEQVIKVLSDFRDQLRIAMFMTGSGDLSELKKLRLTKTD